MKKVLTLVTVLLMMSAPSVFAQEPCYGDFDCDGDVKDGDIALFKANMGRFPGYNPCPDPCTTFPTCEGDLSALGRWCDQLDGTVKDMTNGLVWLKKADWGW